MKKPKVLYTAFSTYQIIQAIGQGGNGFVYEAEENGNKVAIKVLDPKRATKEKLKRFENEYRFCSLRRHQNIICVIDHGLTDNGSPFFVMPLYKGSIRNLIGKLNEDECFSLSKNIIDGVEAAHKYDAVHRDLKPENILHNNSHDEVVIADFGIAEFGEDELFTAVETKDGTRLANFQYAAPEQRIRNGTINKTTDIYSLGIIINEIFTGELPLGKNHKTITENSEKYGYLDIVVERMLQQDKNSRYQELGDVKREISALSREYFSAQKISQLNNTVIPAHEIDDPIVADPIKIIDVGWDNGILNIYLNHQPNYLWQWALRNMGSYTSVMGKDPETFSFRDAKAVIDAKDGDEAQRIIGYFKQWLPMVARVYETRLLHDAQAAEQEKIQQVKKNIEREEMKKSINENLTF